MARTRRKPRRETKHVPEESTPRYGSKVVDLLLVSLCSGCGYREETCRSVAFQRTDILCTKSAVAGGLR